MSITLQHHEDRVVWYIRPFRDHYIRQIIDEDWHVQSNGLGKYRAVRPNFFSKTPVGETRSMKNI